MKSTSLSFFVSFVVRGGFARRSSSSLIVRRASLIVRGSWCFALRSRFVVRRPNPWSLN